MKKALSLLIIVSGLLYWGLPHAHNLVQNKEQQTLTAKPNAHEINREIVFDSNRSGSFGIYILNLADKQLNLLVDDKSHEMYPAPSADGKFIAYAKTSSLQRDAYSEVWIVGRDGTNQRQLIENATFPSFSKDGRYIYFERSRRYLYKFDLSTEEETLVFPPKNSEFSNFMVVKPLVSPDEKWLSFASDKNGRWNAWIAKIDGSQSINISRGCEPTWFNEGSKVAWVKKGGSKERSGIYLYENGITSPLQDAGAPFGHEYFPTISGDGRYLTYAACDEGQHSHIDANYQLFVKDLKLNEITRITFDQFTNRWPRVLPQVLVSQ